MPCLCGCRDDKEYSCPCDDRILELRAEVDRWKTLLIDEFVLRGLSPDEAREAVHVLERVRVA